MKFYLVLFGSAVVGMLTSCEGGTDYERSVRNLTADTLHVSIVSNWDSTATDYTVYPGKTKVVMVSSLRGGIEEPQEPLFDVASMIVTNGSDTLKKDVFAMDAWTIESEHQKKAPSIWFHAYQLTVVNDDFQ